MHNSFSGAVMGGGGEAAPSEAQMRRGTAGASGASWPAFPCREISRWKKQARSGDIRRLLSAWRTAGWAYWTTPQQWHVLGAHMVTGHTGEVASGAAEGGRKTPPLRLLPAGAMPPKRSVRYCIKGRPESSHATGRPPRPKQASSGWCLRHESSRTRYGSFPFIFCWHCRDRFRWTQRQLPTPASPW